MSKNQTAFQERVDKSLNDDFLRKALVAAQEKLRNGKKEQSEILGNWENWRKRAEQIRQHTIENLDSYLEQFALNAEKQGAKVFFATDKTEAVEYIKSLAIQKKAKSIVKSKSMVSEEIHLNQALESAGIEVVETDLGEYIIQLAKETPSHIIVPAIHKTKEQVAELFSKVAGEELPADPQELAKFARKVLREKFLQADIGVSGANFAVAESGSIVLFSNEGNARLTTTLPKTHVVTMGMERIVPNWEALDSLLSLLPRSATGQKITSYVTGVTGPKRVGDVDGPEEMHIVIIDNGRLKILGTEYQDILHCIRCGACLNHCPVYRHIGGHAYGSVYPGPIGSVLTPLLNGLDEWKELPYASSLCGACSETCPVGIPLDNYLVKLRRDVVETGRASKLEKIAFQAFGFATGNPSFYKLGVNMADSALKPFAKGERYLVKAPFVLKNWTKVKDLPMPPKLSFRQWWAKEGEKQDGR